MWWEKRQSAQIVEPFKKMYAWFAFVFWFYNIRLMLFIVICHENESYRKDV